MPKSVTPTFESEQLLFSQGIRPVAGVDEAGRGPLAGPVIAAAVILPENFSLAKFPLFERLNDSKKLSARVRDELFLHITTQSDICWAIGEGSVEEIGEINILRATGLAMRRALENLFSQSTEDYEELRCAGARSITDVSPLNSCAPSAPCSSSASATLKTGFKAIRMKPAHVLVDGLPMREIPMPQTALVGGDGLSLSIAAASIVAKVIRDRMMEKLDQAFPQYGFARHRGYGTAYHLAMLREHGPCPHHRRGFAPVDQATFRF